MTLQHLFPAMHFLRCANDCWLKSTRDRLHIITPGLGRSTMGDLPRGLGPLPGGCRFTPPLQATPHPGLKVLQTSSMALPLGTHNSAPSILAAGRSRRPTLGTNMMHSGQVLAGCLHRTTLFLCSHFLTLCSSPRVWLMAAVEA
ncbi:hypothetical protein E2C01_019536 [Portunus trituberculatus]|uniref:Uncharacterized protein n=1 Tax=Portunus trituberculatus TaxID=210409 RepID=A0A5B7DZ41_PORTR|nr:hypothetical protein [Portunus trituberculatus]